MTADLVTAAAVVDSGTNFVQILLVIIGSGGLLSGLVAVYKLRPDINNSAVVQAQGTMDIMKSLVDELRKELETCKKDCVAKDLIIKEQENLIKHLRDTTLGLHLWDKREDD